MLQTWLVYSSLTLFMCICSILYKQFGCRYFLLFVILSYSIVFGFRYGVGTDYFTYLYMYDNYQWSFSYYDYVEPAFKFFTSLLAHLNLHFSVYFFIIAFLQILMMYALFYPKEKNIYPFLSLFLMLSGIWLSFSNIMRQELAFCFFVFSIKYIQSREIKYFLVFICLAGLIHKTAFLLVIMYFLFSRKRSWLVFVPLKWQYLLLGFSLFLSSLDYVEQIFMNLFPFASYLGFDKYYEAFELGSDNLILSKRSEGIAYMAMLAVDVLLIFLYPKVLKRFPDGYYPIMYDLYFCGMLLSYIVGGSILLMRPLYYLTGFKFIVASYSLMFLYYNKKYIFFFLLIVLYLLYFIALLINMDSNTVRYLFFWQSDQYIIPVR